MSKKTMDKKIMEMLEKKTKEIVDNEIKPNSELIHLIGPDGKVDYIIEPQTGWIFVRKALLQNTKSSEWKAIPLEPCYMD
jgi:hypothetical protein